jgi:methyl-accepting chemotaxis protein
LTHENFAATSVVLVLINETLIECCYPSSDCPIGVRQMFWVRNFLKHVARGWLFHNRDQLATFTLNNMTQGVMLWNISGRLVMCNDRYLQMYGISADVAKPGTALIDILRRRAAAGSFHRDPAKYCAELMQAIRAGKTFSFVTELPDGRSIAVDNRPILGSIYWIGIHDDITERLSAERKSAALSERESRRRACVDEAIAWFREGAESASQTVTESVAAIKLTATKLSATSNETTAHAASVVDTSNDAVNLTDVASAAAHELVGTIAEINRQVDGAAAVVHVAVTEAQSTNHEIASLARAAQKIDDVVKLIQSVARQTNLLALNATIEAARCGAMGKGFAVVASELKVLAVQTANATDDIAAQIAAVQGSTESAVCAIGRITGRMDEIKQFTAAISAAVGQQQVSTGEISNNVAKAAAGTKSIAAVLQRVSAALSDMRGSADTVLVASEDFEKAAGKLRGSIDGFLSKVAN